MALTKHQSIAKVLAEEMLRRHPDVRANRSAVDIKLAISIMNLIVPPGPILIIADTRRMADHFASVMGRPFVQLTQPEQCKGMYEGRHIVRLHTGRRTQRQQDIVDSILAVLEQRPDCILWHVGDWSV